MNNNDEDDFHQKLLHAIYNGPEISQDRLFQQSGINQYTVLFLSCNHFLNIPWRVIHGMLSTMEVVEYINQLKCKMCEEDFSNMEKKLNDEYKLFIKYGGKL